METGILVVIVLEAGLVLEADDCSVDGGDVVVVDTGGLEGSGCSVDGGDVVVVDTGGLEESSCSVDG